jgi:hypothetical protein
LAIASGHHTLPQGPLIILDPTAGGNSPDGIRVVTQGMRIYEGKVPGKTVEEGGRIEGGGFYTDPWALNEKSFLASYAFDAPTAQHYNQKNEVDVASNGYGIYLVDVFGNKELLYRDLFLSAFNPRPLSPRKTPPILPDQSDHSLNYATCIIPDVQQGMDSIEPGTVRYIRISEPLPWPIVRGEGAKRWVDTWFTWDSPDATRWSPVRVIGVVPVEADGSAYFKVPVADNASVYFQALDENFMEVRRMRSSISFAPGEQRSCAGCHETKTAAVASEAKPATIALKRSPSEPVPPAWGARKSIHFARDVQPVFDKHCIACHSGNNAAAGFDFTAEKSYRTIKSKRLVAISNIGMNGDITKVKEFGSHASRLTQALTDPVKKEQMKVKLSDDEWLALVTWVDANIPYTGLMFHKIHPDGRTRVWDEFDWGDPWGIRN